MTRAFSELPQLDRMQIWFTCHVTRKADETMPVLSVSLDHYGRLWHLDPRDDTEAEGRVWNIRVSSVPRSINAHVRSSLLESGLHQLADWINKPRSEIWFASNHSYSLNFSPRDDILYAIEYPP